MKLIKSDTNQCVLNSFAMVLRTDPETLIQRLGHDGLGKIVEQPVPACFRSFHPEEFADLLVQNGMSMTMFSLQPMMAHGDHLVDHSLFMGKGRFEQALGYGDGVLFGVIDGSRPHAVAWNYIEEQVYDPRGYTWKLNKDQDLALRQFFLIQKVQTQ